MNMRKLTTTISTVFHRDRGRLAGMAARTVDVNPGSGEIEFTFDLDIWERYRFALQGSGTHHDVQDAWVMMELYLWQKALKYPVAWMMLMQSTALAFTDHHRYGDQGHPRVVTAVLIYRILRRLGYDVALDAEYSTPVNELKRQPRW